MKERLLNEILNRVNSGVYEIEANKEESVVKRNLFIYLMPSNLIVSNVVAFLVDTENAIEGKEIKEVLDKVVELIDKQMLVRLLSEHLSEAVDILNVRIQDDFRIFPVYPHENGFGMPFFIESKDYFVVDTAEEMLQQFTPILNEWVDKLEGFIVGTTGEKYLFSPNAVLEVEKVSSKKEALSKLELYNDKYEQLKFQYPEETELVERILYDK